MGDRPRVSIGFLAGRDEILAALYVMGAASCSYSSGGVWSERCDCKYGVEQGRWPTVSERGCGCPELRSAYAVIDSLTDEEWRLLTQRVGGVPSGLMVGHAEAVKGVQAQNALKQIRGILDANA